jgi:predicted nucleotidyltransferase/(2Fe-2S) ferredoxin
MSEPSVEAADAVLRKHGIRYAVVGGQAIARNAATATRDVDVLVTTADYRTAVDRLREDDELTLAWEGGPVTRFGIAALRGVPLDVVDAGFFAGTKTGEEFFDFLVHEQATEADGILFVSPEAVWYMRLMTKRWRTYAEKIVTNVLDGLTADRLQQVEEIARRFGTEETIRERIAYVREELDRPDLRSLTGDG